MSRDNCPIYYNIHLCPARWKVYRITLPIFKLRPRSQTQSAEVCDKIILILQKRSKIRKYLSTTRFINTASEEQQKRFFRSQTYLFSSSSSDFFLGKNNFRQERFESLFVLVTLPVDYGVPHGVTYTDWALLSNNYIIFSFLNRAQSSKSTC